MRLNGPDCPLFIIHGYEPRSRRHKSEARLLSNAGSIWLLVRKPERHDPGSYRTFVITHRLIHVCPEILALLPHSCCRLRQSYSICWRSWKWLSIGPAEGQSKFAGRLGETALKRPNQQRKRKN